MEMTSEMLYVFYAAWQCWFTIRQGMFLCLYASFVLVNNFWCVTIAC